MLLVPLRILRIFLSFIFMISHLLFSSQPFASLDLHVSYLSLEPPFSFSLPLDN